MLVKDWRGDLTAFAGPFNTYPSDEAIGASWGEIVAFVAPLPIPSAVREKNDVVYIVPCRLTTAPLVGKTAQKAIEDGRPSVGKMRSASHVTASAYLKFDLDGITEAQWGVLLESLHKGGVTFLGYTTHSHGRPDKPGYRVRVFIPIDRELAQIDYTLAWIGAAESIFGAVAHTDALDRSAAKIHQQQGVYATAPERTGMAFRLDCRKGIASADALIARGTVGIAPVRCESARVRGCPKSFGDLAACRT
jgi:hypothetical protein